MQFPACAFLDKSSPTKWQPLVDGYTPTNNLITEKEKHQ
nr:MAG TPA: hypothetical protein [Caudoviricetes sp.]